MRLHKVSEDDLMDDYSYQMTNFEIKIILSVKRPLKVLYSEETHNPPEEDICQHVTCPTNKGEWESRKGLILGGFGEAC